ncbi:MAG: hypothetical protein QM820_26945 [Minicystis sp.]
MAYGQGSTFGSGWTESASSTYEGGWAVNTGLKVSDGSGMAGGTYTGNGGWTSESSSSTTVSISKTTGSTLSVASSQDLLNHQNDLFILWTNAQLSLTQSSSILGTSTQGLLAPTTGDQLHWIALTVGELAGTVTPQSLEVQQYLATLTPADKASILALDPLRYGHPSWYPYRYVPYGQSVAVAGPDIGLTDTITLQVLASMSSTGQTTNTSFTGDSGGMSLALSVLSLGETSSGKHTLKTVVSGTQSQSTTQSASATLKSTTLGHYQTYDVYYDRLFKTFAFEPIGQMPSSPCADGSPSEIFGPHMAGCAGTTTYPNRASLCGAGTHVCSASEWINNFGGTAPTHNYWTNDPLKYGGTSNACWASTVNGYACPTDQPMRVCSGAVNPEGNICNWYNCGSETASPNDYFGGCYNNPTAGALCCY